MVYYGLKDRVALITRLRRPQSIGLAPAALALMQVSRACGARLDAGVSRLRRSQSIGLAPAALALMQVSRACGARLGL